MYQSCYHVTIICLTFQLPRLFAEVIPQDPGCQKPLGMENKMISNDQLFSPMHGTQRGFGAREARLNGRKAYCTAGRGFGKFHDDVYMEIDLRREVSITAIALQGDKMAAYSNKIKLSYSRNDEEYGNNSIVIAVNGKKGNHIEYIPLKPIIASKMKIQLQNTYIHRCVRMEIYGCRERSNETYEDCELKEAILQTNRTLMTFSQTESTMAQKTYSVENLIFSKPAAWCLSPSQAPPYKHQVTIGMNNEYLIYSIQLKGLKQESNAHAYMSKLITVQYSLNGEESSSIEGRLQLSTSRYKEKTTFKIPLVAKYIYISMNITEKPLTCIKLELFGCQVTRQLEEEDTDKSAPRNESKGKMSIGLIVLLALTVIAVVVMTILFIRWKRNKSAATKRGPLPDIPTYSNLQQQDDVDVVELLPEVSEGCGDPVYEGCKDPIYAEPTFVSVGASNIYENTPTHNDKKGCKERENLLYEK